MVGNSLKEIQTLEVPVMAKMAAEGFFFMAKKIVATVDRYWRPFLKDIADEKFAAASTTSQDDDGEILLSNLAGHGSLSQLDNLQIKNNISAEQIKSMIEEKHVLEKEVAKVREIVNGLSSKGSKYNGSTKRIFCDR